MTPAAETRYGGVLAMRRPHGDRTRLGRTTAWTALTLSALTFVGCSSALETGYVPRPLGSTSTERRGYYASPFTPEAAAAAAAQTQIDPTSDVRSMRKPGGTGYRGP